jgi:hypothetical protein
LDSLGNKELAAYLIAEQFSLRSYVDVTCVPNTATQTQLGVADLLAARAFGPGLLEPTPGPAIGRLHESRPQRLAGG